MPKTKRKGRSAIVIRPDLWERIKNLADGKKPHVTATAMLEHVIEQGLEKEGG